MSNERERKFVDDILLMHIKKCIEDGDNKHVQRIYERNKRIFEERHTTVCYKTRMIDEDIINMTAEHIHDRLSMYFNFF